MIRGILNAGICILQFSAGLLAAGFILFGLLSVLCTFRTGSMAFVTSDLYKYRPDTESDVGQGFAEMMDINPDIAAWLTIYDTNIDYPVLQGRSDMEYINKDAYGNHSISGSVFLSVINKRDFSEPYQLIYGHNMENGAMFGDIDEFTDEVFFSEHSGQNNGVLITDNKTYDLNVFAILKTDAYDSVIYEPDKTEDELDELVKYIQKKAMYKVDDCDAGHVLALSTCDGGVPNGRNVLFCIATERTVPVLPEINTDHKTRRKASGHRNEKGNFGFLDFAVMLVTLYIAFPVHLIKTLMGEPLRGRIIRMAAVSISLGIIIVTEDLNGSMEAVSSYTPIMILISVIVWLARYFEYRGKSLTLN